MCLSLIILKKGGEEAHMDPIFVANQNKKHAARSLWTYWNEKETHKDKTKCYTHTTLLKVQ